MSWTVGELAGFCAGRTSGDAQQRVDTVSTDTRKISPGALFVALQGENFDGHDYVSKAVDAGAVAVMVARDVDTGVPAIRVDDTVLALGELARGHRERFELPVLAITGSNGKTTTKELCASVLAAAGVRARRTPGNLNNHIGLPLSVLQLDEHDQALVVEMGMNHEGEIAALARIAQPTIGAITNVAPAHLGPLGSIEAIARAKGELYEGLREDGTAIVNADNVHCVAQAERFSGRKLSFGTSAQSDYRAVVAESADGHARFELHTREGSVPIALRAIGAHLIEDALCAAATAAASGLLGESPLDAIRSGLEAFDGVPGRLAIKHAPGELTLIDDSYNANPQSARAALSTLAQMRGDGRAIAVLGDMLELGPDEAELHAGVGRAAAELGIDVLIGVGPLSRNTALAAEEAGVALARHADDAAEAAVLVRAAAKPRDTILIKGSRGMQMERVVSALEEVS